jgi:hypothetical protein
MIASLADGTLSILEPKPWLKLQQMSTPEELVFAGARVLAERVIAII